MRIIGSKKNVLDADLLERLAKSKMSPTGVTLAEAQKHIAAVRRELKDEFSSTTRGLTAAQLAVENTLKLAITSGWVKPGAAKTAINTFLAAKSANGLDAVVTKIREELKGSSSGSVGYTSRRTRSVGT
jgi:hypothetical protein